MAERSSWERVRWQTANLLNVHTKKGTSIKPKDLVVFPWEENEQSKQLNTGFALLKSLANKK